MGEPALVAAPVQFAITAAPTQPVAVTASSGAQVIFVPVPGGRGPTGPAGNGAQVFGETPAGTQDGSNPTFTLANPFTTGTTAVYRNGLREDIGVHYTESPPNTITFNTAPLFSDDIAIDYLIA